MRYQPLMLLIGSFAMFVAVGCSPDAHSFNVSVKNATETPLTLILTKNVPQNEERWASPEDLITGRAIEVPGHRNYWVELPPNKTASKAISGEFKGDEKAILRIYRGNRLRLKELEIMNPGPDRQDIPLRDGDNNLIVHDKGGKQLDVEVLAAK